MEHRTDLELVEFINSDLTWNAVKKGPRSMKKRPRRLRASSFEFGFGSCSCSCSGHKMQDSAVFDYEKWQSGVAVLGQHFAEEVLDVPIKKRILLLQSHQKSELLEASKHDLNEKEVPDLNDFSGIELLAAAACHSSVYDTSGNIKSSAVEEHTTPIVDSYPNGIKHDIVPMESNDSPVQDVLFPVTQNLCDSGNGEGDKMSFPPKDVRLHWDLNTLMEQWPEPSFDVLVDPHSEKSYLKDVLTQVRGDECGKHDAAISAVHLSKPEIFGIQRNNDVVDSFVDSCVSKSDIVDSFVHPVNCEKVSTSSTSVSPEQTTIKVESDDKQAVSEVVQGGYLSLKGDGDDKVTSEDRLSDCCGSNVSQDKEKADYDSPAEDGELREYTWQKNEVEERECVDYESDNMYEDNFDTVDSVKKDVTLDHHQTIRELGAVSKNDFEQDDKVDTFIRPKLPEHSQGAILEEKDGKTSKFLPERKSGDIVCIDRSTSFGVRKYDACIRRSRSDNIKDSYSRAERDFGPEKLNGRRARNDASGQWGDWDSRNGHGYPRPKTVIGGSSRLDNNRTINYNPRGNYRTFNTSSSPSDRNDSYGIHRSISRDRSRGGSGSGYHLSGLRRHPQEEYNDPEPCYSDRKFTYFSPNVNRGAHLSQSRRRSRSRSRSGSPIAWNFQKKRNVDTKRQSPDYKPDARFPFRKPSEIETSRSFDDRNRRSPPVRTFHKNQRFEAGQHQGRLKSNDHFRPTSHPARFPHATGPNKFDKYGMTNEERRFGYDVYTRNKDNGFRYAFDENRCFRDPVGRDIPENTSDILKDDLQRK